MFASTLFVVLFASWCSALCAPPKAGTTHHLSPASSDHAWSNTKQASPSSAWYPSTSAHSTSWPHVSLGPGRPGCYTLYGGQAPPYVSSTTTTKTITDTVTVTTTSTSVTTITPPPVTTTISTSVTSTTTTTLQESTETDTSTTTVITTSTSTAPTSTSFVTSTSTATTTSSLTATVPAPSGFLPAGSTLPSAVVDNPARKRGRIPARDLFAGQSLKRDAPDNVKVGLWTDPEEAFGPAQAVVCTTEVDVTSTITTITTASTILTTTAPTPTSTDTTTISITSTITINPGTATTTVTTTSTTTATTITTPVTSLTTTTTTTTTTFVVGSTAYPACVAANRIGTINYNGLHGIDSVLIDGNIATFAVTTDTTSQTCCQSCALNDQCGSFFFAVSNAGRPVCSLTLAREGATCSTFGQYDNTANFEQNGSGAKPDQGLIIGNMYCGVYNQFFTPSG